MFQTFNLGGMVKEASSKELIKNTAMVFAYTYRCLTCRFPMVFVYSGNLMDNTGLEI